MGLWRSVMNADVAWRAAAWCVLSAASGAALAQPAPPSPAPAPIPPAGGASSITIPIRTDGPKSLDPVRGSTAYDNQACCQFYETLTQYRYFERPATVTGYTDITEPLLLAEMPKVSPGPGATQVWSFRLRDDVRFCDDACFPGGKGRRVVSADVFYSWRRLVDPKYEYENFSWLQDTILGFDAYKDAQAKAVEAGKAFDYNAPVEGFHIIDDQRFEVVLAKPVVRFGWLLAMFQLSVVPHEAVERYTTTFGKHPVGSGPFILKREEDWKPGQNMVIVRNPTYHDERYPSTFSDPGDHELGFDKDAGKKLPLVDRVEFTFYTPDPPMWQDFVDGKIGFTQVPAEYYEIAFNKRTHKLRPELAAKGIVAHDVPLLDFIFDGFNMEDPVVGGYTPQRRALRQAISLALDLDARNEAFYNGINIVYDGPIPPPLDGFPKGGSVGKESMRGPQLARARRLLVEAGYPGGQGLPEIDYYTSAGGNSGEQTQMMVRQLARVGIRLNPKLMDFSELIDAIKKKKAPFFGFSWGSDYPDPEDNLQLFYSKYASPGNNSFNYADPDYDKMYEDILVRPPGPERSETIAKMRDKIIKDCPYVGSMARTRSYLVSPSLRNFKPTEDFYTWVKYLDVARP